MFWTNIKSIRCSNIKSISWERINRFSCRILWHLLALPPRGAKVLSTITVHHLDNDDIIYPDWWSVDISWLMILYILFDDASYIIYPNRWNTSNAFISANMSGLFFSKIISGIFCSLQCDCGDNDCPRYEKFSYQLLKETSLSTG